jgi:hypothetical protein
MLAPVTVLATLKIDNENEHETNTIRSAGEAPSEPGVQFALACDVNPLKSAIGIDHAVRGHGENAARSAPRNNPNKNFL